MSDLIPFIYSNLQVRVILTDGEPWFVLIDLCKVLEITNSRNVALRLDPHDLNTVHIMDGKRGNPNKTIVNESGMYDVVMRSDKAEARNFKRWITAEVLPTIRKTGGAYITPGSQAAFDLTNPETRLDALRQALDAADEIRAKLAVEQTAHEETKSYVKALEPPATAWLNLADAEGAYSMADAAKILSRDLNIIIGRTRLFDYLDKLGWIFRDRSSSKRRWKAYQARIDDGSLTMPATKEFWHEKLERWMVPEPSVRVTPMGLRRLHTLMTAGVTV